MKNKVQAVLFDAVGTLFRSRGTIGEIYSDTAARHRVIASPEHLDELFDSLASRRGIPTSRRVWREFVSEVFATSPPFEDFDAFFDDLFSVFRSGSGWRLFPETEAVLEQLHDRGLVLGLVTSFDNRVLSVLEDLRIARFFDTVQTAESSRFQKPDPRFFLEAGANLEIPPTNTLVVGDDPIQDLQAAQQAGMPALLVDRRLRADDRRQAGPASFVIQDLRGVVRHVAGTPPKPSGSDGSPSLDQPERA